MASRDYDRLSLEDFSHQLFETEDLDPIYVMLYKAQLGDDLLKRWSLAYWCYYHAGTASDVAEAPDFWGAMYAAYEDTRSRGTERRHFRGKSGLKALDYLSEKYPNPESAVDYVMKGSTFDEVTSLVCEWPIFGPWIAFKVADMVDRVFGVPVDFDSCELSLYDAPVKGAKLYNPEATLQEVVDELILKFASYEAPPAYDRKVGLQEVETCLCKWKSHLNGHYPVGIDIHEIRHLLSSTVPGESFGTKVAKHGELAQLLLSHVPEDPLSALTSPEPKMLPFFK